MKNFLISGLLLMLATTLAYAGGYRVGAQGQRALAMGHAGVGVVNSAETAFFNPSGLVYLEERLTISAGITGVFSDVKWQNTSTGQFAETQQDPGTPFYFHAAYKVNEWLSLGLSVSTPYGSSVEWEKNWPGSHLVNDIELAAIYIQPLVSVKLSEHFSIGGGPIFVTGNVNFNRNANRTLTDEEGNRSNITIDDSGVTNTGWSASFMFTPVEELRIGFNYRSEILLNSEGGEATFSDFPNSTLTPQNGTTAFTATLPMPAELTIGFAYEMNEKWLFAFDYQRVYWEVYNSLDIDFASPNIPTSVNPRNYKNASSYRFGAQYLATENLSLRAGYYFDESPVQAMYFAPETPRNDANGYTAGLSLQVSEKFAIDASFLYLRFKEIDASYDFYTENGQNVPFAGTYKSSAFLPGIGVTYKL
ncbi:OmpP1/FadL family transporter [Psychroflexus sediminis]|uniref:Long-chain fatty acid transport protein n=1 Tax=Psychroflexus sediminis TaxID=470826 RepID=A0A1G7X287_9FLAO|nr:outer membrane protein transport protein [Psychroflexus sediminis]SDG78299.1 long-chain fatty acid transport protein [Psychroflexus sediminis]